MKISESKNKSQFMLIDPNVKIKTKIKSEYTTTKTAILTVHMIEGQDKTDILKEWNQKDTENKNYSKMRCLYLNYMNTMYPHDHNWTNIRPSNGGYHYMKFFPKNNPVKFTLTYQINLKRKDLND